MIVAGLMPQAEFVHWGFAAGFLMLGLLLLAEAVVGPEIWARRSWRPYLWPSIAFGMGVLMWPVMTFYTNSAIHMVAHGLVGGGADALRRRGARRSPAGSCTRSTGG